MIRRLSALTGSNPATTWRVGTVCASPHDATTVAATHARTALITPTITVALALGLGYLVTNHGPSPVDALAVEGAVKRMARSGGLQHRLGHWDNSPSGPVAHGRTPSGVSLPGPKAECAL